MTDPKYKVCIVGFGKQARGAWMRAIGSHADFRLTSIVDTDTELLSQVEMITKGQVKEENCYMKTSEMVKFEEEKPDLIVVASPIPSHHVLVKQAIDAGIHVACEKNMASSIYQGKQMVQMALDNPELVI